jgi:UDP-2,3-diacylglucosamine hydrolase
MKHLTPINAPSVFLSDLHVKDSELERSELLKTFLNSEQTKLSQQIFFLGDIFDLMIGPHPGYLVKYKYFFDTLAEYIKQGKTIYYFQGNHDFHLEKLISLFHKQYKLEHGLYLINEPILFKHNDKTLYLSHGDELDIENKPYQRYKKIIRSPYAKFLANHLVSESMLNKIGAYFAKKSKDNQKDFNWNSTFILYRNYVQKLWDSGIHGVIVGHSHVCDAWEEGIHFYYNIGYTPHEKQFLFLDENGLQFVPLD